MTRTVHRLNRVFAFFRTGHKHIVFIVFPVARFSPEGFIHNLRRFHLFITGSIQLFAHMLLNHLPQSPAFRMPEHHTRRFILQVEQIQLFTQLTVVAFFCFLDALDIGFQFVFTCPSRTVNTLQHFIIAVAAPVCACQFGQLEVFQETGIGNVRTAAHIDVFLMMIHTHCFHFRHVFNQTQFVLFAAILENFDGFCTGRHHFNNVIVLCNQLFHARFNGCYIIRRKWFFSCNIVIESVFNDRADNHFGIRVELLDRMTDQVRAGVADNFHAFFVFWRNDLNMGIFGNRIASIHQFTVNLTRYRCLCQTCTDRRCNLRHGNG